MACAVLHNICLNANGNIPEALSDNDNDDDYDDDNCSDNEGVDAVRLDYTGVRVRNRLVQRFQP